jgi:hypothetical protein
MVSAADVHIILESEIQEAFRLKQHFLIASLGLEKACWRHHIMTTLSQSKIRENMLYFVRNFMTNRSFRVVCGGSLSQRKGIERGVVQRAVNSVTLFLVALSKIPRMTIQPGTVIGYADD